MWRQQYEARHRTAPTSRDGKVTEGRTAAEVVRTYENVRVVTNPEGTRVITVITTGN